jgi:anti-sigma-K factor RskA
VPHIDPDLLALLALGEDAAAEDRAHLARCPECATELQQLAKVVSVAHSGPDLRVLDPPPPGLWVRVAAAAGVDPAPAPVMAPGSVTAPVTVPAAETGRNGRVHMAASAPGPGPVPDRERGRPHARPAWWRRRPLLAAAAGLVAGLLIGAGGAAGIHQLAAGPATRVVASIPLRSLPQFPQWRGASGTAVMAQGPHGQQITVSLHAPRRPGFYEVWLLARNGTSMISLGDLGPGHSGKFTMPPGVDLANYSRIDVSLQPFNGSTLHSRTSVVRGSIPQ